ncbi:LysR family transcriptional regulator [Mycetocola tolaasinivorans]|uniref:LysR family transcriptional regulator n=1 Tax=Mycetocola tolaasinivorans TaxID=76635 RepID=UPI00248219BE|nr:LysR family transcriptional regulator [Mycetocola tolaasinivorans]
MGEIDTAALRMLVAVAESGSLSAAAGRLGVTQQAVSVRIRTLESRLGIALVRRSPRGSTMTPEGTVVAGWAAEVVSAADSFAESVHTLTRTDPAPLRIAASLTIAEYLVPEWLHRLRAAGTTRAELTAANSATVATRVREGSAEIGFIESPEVPAGLDFRWIATDELIVVVAPSHPWARRTSGITPEELAARPLVVREEGSGTREALNRALGDALVHTAIRRGTPHHRDGSRHGGRGGCPCRAERARRC